MRSSPYDTIRDFAAIIPLAQYPNVLVVPPSRFKTVQDLVAAGKAKPGSITYGSGGVGAATHLNAERFRLSAGFEAVHVPFKGAPEALREILGDRIDFYFSPILSAVPLIQSGQVRGLAVSSLARSDTLPDIPTTSRPAIPTPTTCSGSACSRRRRRRATSSIACTTPRRQALADKAVADNLKALGAAPMAMTPDRIRRLCQSGDRDHRKGREGGGDPAELSGLTRRRFAHLKNHPQKRRTPESGALRCSNCARRTRQR